MKKAWADGILREGTRPRDVRGMMSVREVLEVRGGAGEETGEW